MSCESPSRAFLLLRCSLFGNYRKMFTLSFQMVGPFFILFTFGINLNCMVLTTIILYIVSFMFFLGYRIIVAERKR